MLCYNPCAGLCLSFACSKKRNHVLTKKRNKHYTLMFLVALGIIVGCDSRKKDEKSVTISTCEIVGITSLDPAENYMIKTMEYLANTYYRLFRCEGMEVQKDLTESCEFSKDGRRALIQIKKDYVFASGRPITAHDVVYSIVRAMKMQKVGSDMLAPLGWTAENVDKNLRCVDDYTVEMTFPEPLSSDLVCACLACTAASIVDTALVKKHTVGGDYGNGWLRTSYAGGGAFGIVTWQPGELLVLKKNVHQKGPEPMVNTLVVRQISDAATACLLLKRGEIDIAYDLHQEQVKSLDPSQFTVIKHNTGGVWYLNLNQQNVYLRNPKVQKAIRHLINYKNIVHVFGEDVTDPLPTLIPRGFQGYRDDFSVPKFDPAAAKKLVHEAFGSDICLEMDTCTLGVAQAMQSDFAKGGIKLKINYCDNKQVTARLRGRAHVMSLKYFGADFSDAHSFVSMFIADPGTIAWRNSLDTKDLQGLVQKSTRVSGAEREQIYRELQTRFLEKPLISVAQPYKLLVCSKAIEGFGTSRELFGMRYETVKKHSV